MGCKRSFNDVLEPTDPTNKRYRGGITDYEPFAFDKDHVSVVGVSVNDGVTRDKCQQVSINSRLKRKFPFGNSSVDMETNSECHMNGKKWA